MAELNRVQREHPALWSRDHEAACFRWLDANDADHSSYSFVRYGAGDDVLVVAANLTPVPRHGYRLGVPARTRWREVLNTDAAPWAGSGVVNDGEFAADDGAPWHGESASLLLTLPPLGVVWLAPA
jgi:1,4-alpha-glucan branching enzyme